MKKTLTTALILATVVLAENNISFTPTLLVATDIIQELDKDAEAGSIAVDAVEAGFELGYGENLIGAINLETDFEDGAVSILLNEALVSYSFNDILSNRKKMFLEDNSNS